MGRMQTVLVLVSVVAAAAAPTPGDTRAALDKALAAMATLQAHGGWGQAHADGADLVWGEHLAIPGDWITVQPPATPTAAGVYLRAARVLDDPRWLEVARRAKEALKALQTEEGGFPHEGPPAGPRRKQGTFDDDATTSALRFFLDFWRHTGDPADRADVDRVGAFLLAAQYENGGWPQTHPPPAGGYQRCITFNDNVMVNVIRALFLLHEATGDDRYLDAARRGGECILRLQGGPGEAIWAQQYDPDTLEPAWARNFEPPGYSAGESRQVCELLVELHLRFDDDRYLDALRRALEWYDMNRLPDGRWWRLTEPGTRRPVFGRRDKKIAVYDRAEATTGYGWEGDYYPRAAAAALARIEEIGPAAYRAERAQPANPNTERAAQTASDAIARMDSRGFWTDAPNERERAEMGKRGIPEDTRMVRVDAFVRNSTALLDHLELAK